MMRICTTKNIAQNKSLDSTSQKNGGNRLALRKIG